MIDYEGYEGSNNSNCVMNEQSDTHMIQTARLDFLGRSFSAPRRTWLLLEGPISHDAARGRAGSHRRAPLRGIVRGAGRPAGRRARAGGATGAHGQPAEAGRELPLDDPGAAPPPRAPTGRIAAEPPRDPPRGSHDDARASTERAGKLRRGAGRRPRLPAGPRDAHCPAHLRDGRTRRSGATSPGRAGSHDDDDDDDDDDGGCDAPAHDARAPSRIYG